MATTAGTHAPSPLAVDTTGWPSELHLLLGDDAAGLLSAAVDAAGGELLGWSPRQVTHQPKRSTVVQYRADVRWSDGVERTETLVAATGDRIPPGAAVLDDGTTTVALWRWPFDPGLPGLASALDRGPVERLLDDLGVDGGTVQTRVRAYRPGRRAVVEVTGGRGRLFLKVVRPSTVESLHRTHRLLAARLPVPDSLGWTDDGVLVLPGLPGRTMRELLRSGHSVLPEPAAIESLLDRLPAELATGAPRRDVRSSAAHHATTICSSLPAMRGRVEAVVGELRRHELPEHPIVAVHGDLYEAQILVAGGKVCGLLDVDTAGAGARVDDLANFCAHLSVLTLSNPHPKAIKRYGAALLAHAEQRFDRRDLRTRIAAAVLSLSTGPFRVLSTDWPQATARRLDLVDEWLGSIHKP